jgi:hypothetical protein
MRLLMLVLLCAPPATAGNRIGEIDFFGYKGLDIAKIREALPVHEGDEYSNRTMNRVRQAMAEAIGRSPTDISSKCCDDKGNRMLYIGLPGASYKTFSYNPEPKGEERLSPDIVDLSKRVDEAQKAAVYKGGNAAGEDDSNGYKLGNDPAERSLELALREWAIHHERELLRVLGLSSTVEDRRVASTAVGYIHQSPDQINALVRASRDPDDLVRDNATRALAVLAQSKAKPASAIPPDGFIEMLNSGTWTDRNKAIFLLLQLTESRDPNLLVKIRSAALDSLVEMASWRYTGHALGARMVLGRVAGIPEERLIDLAQDGSVTAIIEAVTRR